MKKVVILIVCVVLVMYVMMLSSCAYESPLFRAQQMMFTQTKKPIGELLHTHPAIDRGSIVWYETDDVGDKKCVIAQFTFTNQQGEQQDVRLEFVLGRKRGGLAEVVTYRSTGEQISCVDLGVFLVALRNKEPLDPALISWAEKLQKDSEEALKGAMSEMYWSGYD